MSFINALLHAAIGYGIRRECWHENAILHLTEEKQLNWLHGVCKPCFIMGDDAGCDLQAEDLTATDWETV